MKKETDAHLNNRNDLLCLDLMETLKPEDTTKITMLAKVSIGLN